MKKLQKQSRRSEASVRPTAVVGELRQRFTAFRKENRRGTRIPLSLRVAAVEAAEQGVPMKTLWLACGVTRAQLEQWGFKKRSGQKRDLSSNEPGVTPARCFSVVEANGVVSGAPEVGASTTLELRVGEWAICIRPLTSIQSAS